MDLGVLVEMAKARGARGLHLVAGKPPSLRQDEGLVVLEDCPAITLEDMRTLCDRILPPEHEEAFYREGQVQFRLHEREGIATECIMVNSLGSASVYIRFHPDESRVSSPAEQGRMN